VDAAKEWLEGLRSFAADHREQRPVAPPKEVDAAWHAERAILGASLATRLAESEAIRAAWLQRGHAGAGPALVLTTSPAGLTAVASLLDGASDLSPLVGDRFVAVTELEYRLWCIKHPDEASTRHVNLWSWVKTSVPPQRWGEFAAFPIADGESYWLHREGMAGAGALDRRACHLWRWNGRHASLLRAFVQEGRVLPPSAPGRSSESAGCEG